MNKRNITYISGPKVPYTLSVCSDRQAGWQDLGQVPMTFQQVKDIAEAFLHVEKGQRVAVRIIDPTTGLVVYLVASSRRQICTQESKTT